MGKKDKKKKGRGAEKTAAKTQRKQEQKLKKELIKLGEDDISSVVKQFEVEQASEVSAIETVVDRPTRCANFTLTAHPDKEELILFGGEYYNGKQTVMYNHLYFYNIPKHEWRKLTCHYAPPPRSAHTAVAVSQGGGQLWMFGGEYSSSSQSQFHHYNDLWVFHFANKTWQKISAPGGPSPRSGHRMVVTKKLLLVFGGYHDNNINYTYHSDLHSFSLENYSWNRLNVVANPRNSPTGRSGCQLAALQDGRVLLYGGYTKSAVKKGTDTGTVHTDMFMLSPDKNDTTLKTWKWLPVKPSGARPSPRSGFAYTTVPGNRAYFFGGVYDDEEDDVLKGNFYNDTYVLELERGTWRTVNVSCVKDTVKKHRRRRRRERVADEEEEDPAEEMEAMTLREEQALAMTEDDGVFKVTVGATTSTSQQEVELQPDIFIPSPRMNAGLAVRHGTLYLYGGIIEDGDKQITLTDFYALDLHKLDEWQVLAEDTVDQEWLDSDSDDLEDEESEEDEDTESEGDDAEEMEEG